MQGEDQQSPASTDAKPEPIIWLSGDFKSHAASTPPYNGVRMTATPGYDAKGDLFSLRLVIEDFTESKKGASVEHTFQPVDSGQDWQLRTGMKPDFTMSGNLEVKRAALLPDELLLMLEDGSYGESTHRRRVIGGLLGIPVKGKSPSDHGDVRPTEHHLTPELPGSDPATWAPDPTQTQHEPASDDPTSPPPHSNSPQALRVVQDASGALQVSGSTSFTFGGRRMQMKLRAAIQPLDQQSPATPGKPSTSPADLGAGSSSLPASTEKDLAPPVLPPRQPTGSATKAGA